MKNLISEWENMTLIKVFEFPVIDNRTGVREYVCFDIELKNNEFVATHESLSKEQEESDKISFVSIDIDSDFTLDDNLIHLKDACEHAIMDGEFFNLI